MTCRQLWSLTEDKTALTLQEIPKPQYLIHYIQLPLPLSTHKMPKPTAAELFLRYPGAKCPPETANMGTTSSTGSDQGEKEPTSGDEREVVGGTAPEAATSAPSPEVQEVESRPYLTLSPSSPCPSLSFSSSLASLSEPCSRSSSDNDGSSDWSDCEFDRHYRHMCRPLEAKALSLATGNFYAVSSLGSDGLVPGDEPVVDGMILQGYNRGHPVYYKFTG